MDNNHDIARLLKTDSEDDKSEKSGAGLKSFPELMKYEEGKPLYPPTTLTIPLFQVLKAQTTPDLPTTHSKIALQPPPSPQPQFSQNFTT
jgi:hypothetical protein